MRDCDTEEDITSYPTLLAAVEEMHRESLIHPGATLLVCRSKWVGCGGKDRRDMAECVDCYTLQARGRTVEDHLRAIMLKAVN